jgi:3-oxoacyl-[acyl-carrier protein] reductase
MTHGVGGHQSAVSASGEARVAIVTGASLGIGRAIAVRLGRLGCRVVVNFVGSEAEAAHTVRAIEEDGGTGIAMRADVSTVAGIDELFEFTMAQFGRIDIVVANAGVEIIRQPVLDATEADFDRLFALNTKGAFFTLQRAGRLVADGGRILWIGSSSSYGPSRGLGLYGSSKMAPRYVVEVLAQEVGSRNVTVNSIDPTVVEGAGVFTEAGSDEKFQAANRATRPLGGRAGRPDDVADAVEYFVSDLAGWVSGQHLLVSGGAPQ